MSEDTELLREISTYLKRNVREIPYVNFLEFAKNKILARGYSKSKEKAYLSYHKRHFTREFANKNIHEITSSEVEALHKSIGATHKSSANEVLKLLSVIFNIAIDEEKIFKNPCKGIKKFEEPPCDRYLCNEELHRLFLAIWQRPTYFKNYFMLLLYVGARSGNVKSMRWDEIDFDSEEWTIPAEKAKGKRKIVIQLSGTPMICLREMQKITGNSPFVFPAESKTGHLAEPKKQWQKACSDAGITSCTMHNLRATFATHLDELGVPIEIISQILGHQNVKTTEIYLRSKRKEKEKAEKARKAVLLLASHFDGLMEVRSAA